MNAQDEVAQWQARLDDCTLLLPWAYATAAGAAPRLGLFVPPPVRMAALVAGTALRMCATIPEARATDAHACTLQCESGAEGACSGETRAEVRIRIRNCGTRSASVCLECGDLGSRPTLPRDAVRSAASAESVTPSRDMVLSAHARYQWLGGARRHVLELPAQAEQECSVRLVLAGCGVFAVDGIVCTWSVPEAHILGRVLQADRLDVFVDEQGVS